MASKLSFFYHILSPPSRACLLVADKLKLKFEKHVVDLIKGEHLTPEYTKLNIKQSIPLLVIDDGKTKYHMTESRAIMIWLMEKYSNNNSLYPNDLFERQKIHESLFFDSTHIFGTVIPLMHVIIQERRIPDKILFDLVEKNLIKFDNILGQSNHGYAAGSKLTLADYSLITSMTTLDKLNSITGNILNLDNKTNIQLWKERVKNDIYNDVNWNENIEQGNQAFSDLVFKLIKKGLIRN